MSSDDYAGFLERMGHRVLRSRSTTWFNVSAGVYMNFPFHRPAEPEYSEISKVLGFGGIAVRYTCAPEVGRPSYKLVCLDKNYSLDSLPQKGRNRTRRGLETCSVRRLAFEELESTGALRLNVETLMRQGRKVPANHDIYWRRYYDEASRTSAMQAWGSFVENELAAYLIACQIEDCMNILILRSHTNYLKANPNNALFYVFTQDSLRRTDIHEVSTGLESPQSDTSELERFKSRMGFEKVPIGQRIEFNSLFRLLLKSGASSVLQRTLNKVSTKESVGKLAGILRWYEEQPALRS